MRVRMTKHYEVETSHPEHGTLTLRYPAGSVQAFDDATATALIRAERAVADPETSLRVELRRSLSEGDIVRCANTARQAAGTPPIIRTDEGARFAKGMLVHLPRELADPLIAAGLAIATPDPDADPVAATQAAAIADAIARKQAHDAAVARRAAVEATRATARRVSTATPPATPSAGAAPTSEE